jgi:hypothetical protein
MRRHPIAEPAIVHPLGAPDDDHDELSHVPDVDDAESPTIDDDTDHSESES